MRRQEVLDHGYVQLVTAAASDLMVVNAARASFDTHVTDMGPRDEGLIGYLMREKHASPFEHGLFTFRVKAPLFVNRQWFKHRIGSFNEESGRYSELGGDFYVPNGRVRSQVGKPGAYVYEPASELLDAHTCDALAAVYDVAWDTYQRLLEAGVAREVARTCLPVATYSTFVWSVNPRSLMNYLSLRNDSHTQEEHRLYAEIIEGHLEQAMPITYAAFVANGRKAI